MTGSEQVVEITTSGLTHTIGRWSLMKNIANYVSLFLLLYYHFMRFFELLGLCDDHRIGLPQTEHLNFGVLEKDLSFTVYDADQNQLFSTQVNDCVRTQT